MQDLPGNTGRAVVEVEGEVGASRTRHPPSPFRQSMQAAAATYGHTGRSLTSSSSGDTKQRQMQMKMKIGQSPPPLPTHPVGRDDDDVIARLAALAADDGDDGESGSGPESESQDLESDSSDGLGMGVGAGMPSAAALRSRLPAKRLGTGGELVGMEDWGHKEEEQGQEEEE